MRSENERILIYWRLMDSLHETNQLEDALSTCLDIVMQETGATESSVWMLDGKSNRLFSIIGVCENDLTGLSIESGQGIIGQVVTSRQPGIVTAGDGQDTGDLKELLGKEIESMICVPMELPDRVIGCMVFLNRKEGSFAEDDVEFCRSLASITALEVEERGYTYHWGLDRKVILSCRNVVKDYGNGENRLRVLKGVDLDIYENEFLVILGESGCGKSTMLNIIGGMDAMTEGSMTVDGKDFSHPSDQELTDYRRDDIGFIFQAYNLMPNLTALENVEFIAEICRDPMDPKEALDMVGLSQRAGNYPSMMSGGQQQRVSIARAIVKKPRIILADEPTAALDYTTGLEVLMVIEELIRRRTSTVIMVTHNVEIAKMANRVIRFKDGRIASIRVNAQPVPAAELVW